MLKKNYEYKVLGTMNKSGKSKIKTILENRSQKTSPFQTIQYLLLLPSASSMLCFIQPAFAKGLIKQFSHAEVPVMLETQDYIYYEYIWI